MRAIPRLPGIAFEVEPPAPAAVLPRMDVAAFVGFAARGPLHTPVPVEDAARFREVFGPDPDLAWDEERGRMERGHLGAAVEAFFRNGGRRCWIVRVAGMAGDGAYTHRFPVPGLMAVPDEGNGGGPLQPALARARSAGSWADGLRVGTRLVREVLPVLPEDAVAPGWIDVAAPPERVLAGDLLEIVTEEDTGYRLVDQAVSRPRGTRLVLTEALPAGPLSVRRLRFELLVWSGELLAARFTDLAFSERHPRFWGLLPDDGDLFRSRAGRVEPPLPEAVTALRAEAASPRFPLAAPVAPAALYLPVGMGAVLDPAGAVAAAPVPEEWPTALHRDGLADFGARIFLDPELAWAQLGALLGEAEHRYYRLEEPLTGFHALLPVEEATLVAVPDAAHRGWTRELPPPPDRLPAPLLDPVPETDSFGRARLTWSPVAGAGRYLLQRAEAADMAGAETVFDGAETLARIPLPAACPRSWYFRVRAFRDAGGGEASPWSATRGTVAPPLDFTACAEEPLPELWLSAAPVLPGEPELLLSWGPLPGELDFELVVAADADFESARQLVLGPETSFELEPVLDAVRFLRVRARRGEALGPWSNTVVVEPAGRASHVLRPRAEMDPADSVLLAVHRALLRFCAARGDLLALLSLPAHFGEEDVQAHLGALIPAGAGQGAPALSNGVPALTAFEAAALSFGALYHPWTLTTPEGEDLEPRRTPPDGAVLGLLAHTAIGRGAWVAAANQPLAGVVGLEPAFGRPQWERLAAVQVNLLRADPRGFLALAADTLSRTEELRPVPVRRLLILLRRLALREGATWVFENHDAALRGLVRHRFERLLSDLYVRGAFAGAVPAAGFRVVVDESVNPPESADLGRLVVELRVAPSRPLSFLRVRLVQTGPEQLGIQEV